MKRNSYAKVLIVLVIAIVLFTYFFVGDSSKRKVKTAATEFAAGDLESVESLLLQNREKISPVNFHLYQAYLFRGKKQLQESNDQLEEALSAVNSDSDASSSLILEIYLNQAMNAYLQRDSQTLHEALDKAKKLVGPDNGWIQFFSGLDDFINGNYEKAMASWKDMNIRRPLSPWMEAAFSTVFTPFFLTNLDVRASIFQGRYIQARQKLSEALKKASESQSETLNFLIGLTYVEEARGKSPVSATPYYRLAFNYLRHVPMVDPAYVRERGEILQLMDQVANALAEQKLFGQISFYLSVFNQWNEQELTRALLTKLIGMLREDFDELSNAQIRALGLLLRDFLPQGDERNVLAGQMERYARQALLEGKVGRAKDYWWVAEQLSADSEPLRQQFLQSLSKQILAEIPKDNADLTATFPYIRLWQSMKKTEEEIQYLSIQLIQLAKRLWKEKDEYAKALKVLVTSSLLSETNQEQLNLAIGEMYADADTDNNIDAFALLFDVMRQLNVRNVEAIVQQVKEELLVEAQEDLSQQRFQQALVKAKWVLQQDPENSVAEEIAANAAFGASLYREALLRLKSLGTNDPEMIKKIAVSELLEGDFARGQEMLQELQQNGRLNDDIFFRVGTEILLQGDYQKAFEWLERVQQKTVEWEMAMMTANAEAGEWQKVVAIYEKLPRQYQEITAIKGLAIIAHGHLGRQEVAEQMLKQILEQKNELEMLAISQSFRPLWIESLKGQTAEVTAGQYYSDIKNEPETALVYLNVLVEPTLKASVLRAKVLMVLERYEEALQTLLEIPEKGTETAKGRRQLEKVLPYLAEVYLQLGFYPEAVNVYRQWIAINPDDDSYYIRYAMALEGVKRYDLALEQYEKAKKKSGLTTASRLRLIETNVMTDKMKEANVLMQEWIEEEPGPSMLSKIKLLRLLLLSEGYSLFRRLFSEVSEKQSLDIEEVEELIAFFLDSGNYKEASVLLKEHVDALLERAAGLFLLARFNLGISNIKLALSYAENALKIDPWFVPARQFLQQYQKDPETVKQRILELQKQKEAFNHILTYQLAYAAEVLKFAEIAIASTEMGKTIASYDLYSMTSFLDKLSQEKQFFPEIDALLGKGYYLLKKYSEAIKPLEKALQLAIAYPEASLTLANTRLVTRNYYEAEMAAKEGLRFQKNNVDLLLTLAMANQLQGNTIDAISALQRVILFRPNSPLPYLALGKLYVQISNPEGARKVLEKALKLMPDNEETLRFLLQVLHDPLLFVEIADPKSLEKRQNEVFEKLRQLNPEKASEIRKKLKEANE